MMQKWKIIILLIAVTLLSLQSNASDSYSLTEVRRLYGQGVESPEAAKELLDLVSANKANDPLLIAYRGGAEALMAKHAWNPYSKLDYLSKSMNTLKEAIDISPQQAEIRFIRFSIQYYIPRFLGFSKNLQEDAHMIALNITKLKGQLDRQTYNGVCQFMISSGMCSNEDLLILQQSLR